MTFKTTLIALSLTATLALSGCGSSSSDDIIDTITPTPSFVEVKDLPAAEQAAKKLEMLTKYADHVLATYTAAHTDAAALKTAIATFTAIAIPTDADLTAVKTAWLTSRVTYGLTEAFRFSKGPIDADSDAPHDAAQWVVDAYDAPEGSLNSWPLDERMIDTVIGDGSTQAGGYTGSIVQGDIAPAIAIDATELADANAAQDADEKDVTIGYHAIEFLLWGQDQDYASGPATDAITNGAMKAGERPVSEYATANDPEAQNRKDYLVVVADIIIDDLQKMLDAWATGTNTNYRAALLGTHTTAANNIAADDALAGILDGMGEFLAGEIAVERIEVSNNDESEEDEHSCFSDNTHIDIQKNYEGFKNIMTEVFLPELSDADKATINGHLATATTTTGNIVSTAETTAHFDYQIQPAKNAGNDNILNTIDALKAAGNDKTLVKTALGL